MIYNNDVHPPTRGALRSGLRGHIPFNGVAPDLRRIDIVVPHHSPQRVRSWEAMCYHVARSSAFAPHGSVGRSHRPRMVVWARSLHLPGLTPWPPLQLPPCAPPTRPPLQLPQPLHIRATLEPCPRATEPASSRRLQWSPCTRAHLQVYTRSEVHTHLGARKGQTRCAAPPRLQPALHFRARRLHWRSARHGSASVLS